MRLGSDRGGKSAPFITFDGLLGEAQFTRQMKWAMNVLREALGNEVDIEFASDGPTLNLLQSRQQLTYQDLGPVELPAHVDRSNVVFEAADKMVPTQQLEGITHIVYVDPAKYAQLITRSDYMKVVDTLRKINESLEQKSFILMGPGRWGTNWEDPALGVPAGFGAINNCALLVEVVDPRAGRYEKCSFGSHFAGDLRKMNIRVLPIYPGRVGNQINSQIIEQSSNMLTNLVPEAEDLPDGLIRVIDIGQSSVGRTLKFASNKRTGNAMAWLDVPEGS